MFTYDYINDYINDYIYDYINDYIYDYMNDYINNYFNVLIHLLFNIVWFLILELRSFARQNYLQPAPNLLARNDNCENGGRIGAAPRGI